MSPADEGKAIDPAAPAVGGLKRSWCLFPLAMRLTSPDLPVAPVVLMKCRLGSAPGVRRHAMSELEHLHRGAAGEDLDHGPGGRLDFGDRLAHGHAGDALDFLAERAASAGEQL